MIQRFELGADSWLKDPRRSAPKSLLQLGEAAQMLAEARRDLAVTKAEETAWRAQQVATLASKYTKWPKWRIDAWVEQEPTFRHHATQVAEAEQDVVVLEQVVFALRMRLRLLGDFYNVGGE